MSRAASSRERGTGLALLNSYLYRSQLPLTCLLFVSPLIVLEEVGTRLFATDLAHRTQIRLISYQFMESFFGFFGATERFLPAFAVVCILLAWHIARHDPWRIELGAAVGMVFESLLLCLPLFILNALLMRLIPLHGGVPMHAPLGPRGPANLVFAVGAGVYEELVFRLIAFTLLSIILVDIFQLRKGIATPLIVCISAVLFSLHHRLGIGEGPNLYTAVFRLGAGIYFGVVFLSRGFGVTVGTHTAYDLFIEVLSVLR